MQFFKKSKGIILCFLICFVLPFCVILGVNAFYFNSELNTFNNNFTLCGVNLGGLTLDKAESEINNKLKTESNNLNLTLNYGNKSWQFNTSDFTIESNIHTVLDSAYKTNRKGNILAKIKRLKKINKMGFTPQVAVRYVLTDIDKKLDDICSEIEVTPVDASATYNTSNDSFIIKESKIGSRVDRDKLLYEINKGLQQSNDVNLQITTIPVEPKLKESDIKKATKLQASFTTNYQSSNADRKNNIKLASSELNGTMVKAGEEFSFNSTIGKRTAERGYKEANIIKDGKFVKGLGGGICQVSTTLYNALILANVNVTEAHPHSLPVSYVSPAMDAMVSWGNADLKFKNTTTLPIFIVSVANGSNLTFKIYGDTKKSNESIKTSSEIIKTIPRKKDKIIPDTTGLYGDKIMFKGEFYRVKQGKDGYEAKAYKEYYVDGKLQNKKLLRHATYNAQQGIVYEGVDTLPEGMTLPKNNEKLN